MPDKATVTRARADKRAGKSASTQAGEFVRREIHQIRKGKHGAKNAKQAIAIGLSEARRAGVGVKPKKGAATKKKAAASRKRATKSTRSTARRSSPARRSASSRSGTASRSTSARRTSTRRSQAALKALKKQPRRAASHLALSRQAHGAARSRTKADRSAAARKAARTRAARSR